MIKIPYKNESRSIEHDYNVALQKLDKENYSVEDDGSIVVELSDGEEPIVEDTNTVAEDHYENLVEYMPFDDLVILGQKVIQTVQNDENSRSDWMRTIEFGLDLLGVKVEEKNSPFPGACSAQHPLLMESAVKFQSKASNELLPANGPVKVKILGDMTEEKELQANRVKNHMNYQLTEEMTEFYPDTERLFLYLALVGSGFKKTYFNSYLNRPCSEFVPADQLVVPNSASDLCRADRYTHILHKRDYELEADFASGLYKKPDEGMGPPQQLKYNIIQKKTNSLIGAQININEDEYGYTLYEQHVMICLPNGLDQKDPDYKLASPYIVTVDAANGNVLGIRRNWRENDELRIKKVPFSHYQFVPSFNFYSYGFLHLLGNLQLTLTACLRSLVDSGQFATLQGGFKLKGVRIADDGEPIYPGQFKDIEAAIMDINKAIMPLPFKEPSNVLFQMLNFIDTKGQKFADSTEQVIADAANYGPVGTTMALLEASTKFFSAIHKRLHAALKQELKTIAEINSETLENNIDYNIENETMRISRKDYGPLMAVTPVSDPNISSSAHRMAKANALLEMASRNPQIHDMREIYKHVYIHMDYLNVDKFLPRQDEAQPQDPMSDLQLAVQGKPIKAFQGQDHKSHIAIKQAFLQDPMSGQNPIMQRIAPVLQANLQEHLLFQFMEQVQAQMQIQQSEQTPDAMAAAAQQVAIMNQQQLQQQLEQAQQSPQDQAALMLAQAELQDTETQAKKQAADERYRGAELLLKTEQLKVDAAREINRSKESVDKLQHDMDKLITSKALDAMIGGLTLPKSTNEKKRK